VTNPDPQVVEAYTDGVEAYHAGYYKRAIEHFALALKLDPTFFRANVFRGLSLMALGELDEAETALRAALDVSPYYHKAFNALGNLYRHKGDMEQASKAFELAAEFDTKNASYHYNLALTERDIGRMEKAYTALEKAHACDPDDEEILYDLGSMAITIGKKIEAAGYFEELIRRHPNSRRTPELFIKVKKLKEETQDAETKQLGSI
jgi:Flp pilus assembly protein TadD